MKIHEWNEMNRWLVRPADPEPDILANFPETFKKGGRVKYQGAGLVDHGPAGVRQGYAEKRKSPVKINEELFEKIDNFVANSEGTLREYLKVNGNSGAAIEEAVDRWKSLSSGSSKVEKTMGIDRQVCWSSFQTW